MATNLLKIPNLKFHENPRGGCHHDTGRQTDRFAWSNKFLFTSAGS